MLKKQAEILKVILIALAFLPAIAADGQVVEYADGVSGARKIGFGRRTLSRRYVPRHLRQVSTFQDDGVAAEDIPMGVPKQGTIYEGEMMEGTIVHSDIVGSDCADCTAGASVDSVFNSGCGVDSCGGCAICPPNNQCGLVEDCLPRRFGGILCNTEWFAGAHGFTNSTNIDGNGSFGFYGGANMGLPLNYLTCGLISGQLGVRSVQSNFSGSPFMDSTRDQLFVTGGVYRRVDHGLQFGVVADILYESWYVETDIVQLRGELSWVYPNGSQLGFRFTDQVQDSVSEGTFVDINGRTTTTTENLGIVNTYRFFYRKQHACGGFGEIYGGFSDNDHALVGMDFELPLNDCWGMQSNFIYVIPEDNSARLGYLEEAWNVSVGITWRPQGQAWWRNYHRPLLPVADNGSLISVRN